METAQGCKYSDLIVEPSELFFEAQEGSRFVPPRQDVFIKKTGPGLPASWDLPTLATWLTLRPNHGRGAKRVRFGVRSIGVAAGKYEVQIVPKSHVPITPLITVHLTVKGEEPPPPPPKPFVCVVCGAEFGTEAELQQHIEEHPPLPTLRHLSISSMGRGAVITPGQDNFTYDDGMVVDLVAKSEEGSRFVNWIGDRSTIADVHAAATTITMKGNYTIIANFEEIPPEPEYNWLEKVIKWILDFFTGPFRRIR